MVWRGMYETALRVIGSLSLPAGNSADRIEALTFEGVAYAHLQQFSAASQRLSEALGLCSQGGYATCGEVHKSTWDPRF